MDSALVTYQLDGTTTHLRITGGHLAVQMLEHATTVTVSESIGGQVTSAHLFRRADYVEITRGTDA